MASQQNDLHAPPRALQFTTQGIAPLSRIQHWESHNAKALISLDIRTIDESPLHATELNLQFPSLRLARVQGTPQIVERSESFIRQNPTDVVAVFFALAGDAFFYHRRGHETLKPGQAIMYDADLPFMRGFAAGLQELVLTIPRPLFREFSGGTSLNQPVRFDFGPGAGTQAQELARMIGSALVSEPPADDTEKAVLELFRLIASGGKAGSGTGYLAAAKGYIERSFGDPGLGTAEVAAAVGISERQLGRAFADAGLTPGRYVLGLRLDRGRELLASPAAAGMTIGEIAAVVGFSSQNYFARTFKERFHTTPLQIRKATRAGIQLD
ncbi:AraC family transcriptional regulator [Paenarthrobacter sp.]|uniref:AraC family transcriptional regulator n=1 Tax=Paenarthrobacter sp. TaxID=1931993 RepID=UPI002811B3A9|nr:AraC family transcriptional regulator [Paenarthrobacter sp.]